MWRETPGNCNKSVNKTPLLKSNWRKNCISWKKSGEKSDGDEENYAHSIWNKFWRKLGVDEINLGKK